MQRSDFIIKHSSLFWYTPKDKLTEIKDQLLVQTILNDGTWNDVLELFQIMGKENVASTFFAAKGRMKNNYYPEIYNLFYHILKKYAQGNTE